ncbi:membrane associated rhomboid family serine protease [Thermovibrio guaymasensis]|uniref:Membrane associated rhomboid family serine protease n=1 Tax=Thermovibrio guaymasensis TaxID=240167 RepID=A0A420W5S6_9BACT|nr:rhomboid family intramembrane serine protease [Thermovibrio guaymasensis]RKQ60364.1 membrane associated rhomboid family serine protease [Thermovibrio guaymasensis]
MIPLKDINPSRTTPVVTILIIIICFFVFLYEVILPPDLRKVFISMFAVIPYEITHGVDIPPPDPLTPYGNLVSYQYLHGSWMHILGNMLFLWVFGDNVEDKLGKLKYFIFYTVCGIVAALIQVLVYPNSNIPLIGASGAISGVLGAYAVLFPRAQIITLVFIFFLVDIVAVPAAVWIAAWFTIQFISAMVSATHLSMGGVAWFAHIGGFIAGIVLVKLMRVK